MKLLTITVVPSTSAALASEHAHGKTQSSRRKLEQRPFIVPGRVEYTQTCALDGKKHTGERQKKKRIEHNDRQYFILQSLTCLRHRLC